MTPEDVSRLLSLVASTDGRGKPTEEDDMLWYNVLPPDVTFADAYQALIRHRQEKPGVFLEPGHITGGVRQLQKERLKAALDATEGQAPIPPGYGDNQRLERDWAAAWRSLVKSGIDWKAAQDEVDRSFGIIRESVPVIDGNGRMKALEALARGFGPKMPRVD